LLGLGGEVVFVWSMSLIHGKSFIEKVIIVSHQYDYPSLILFIQMLPNQKSKF